MNTVKSRLLRATAVVAVWLAALTAGSGAAYASHWYKWGWRDQHTNYPVRPSGLTELKSTFGNACSDNALLNRNISWSERLPDGTTPTYTPSYHKKLGGIGGVYDTEAQAEAAVDASNQGELQGYYLAATNDFDLKAVYADARPPSLDVPCDDAALAGATETLPELEQVSVTMLVQECNSIISAKEKASRNLQANLKVLLDSMIVRVPVIYDMPTSLADPADCMPGASCLEGVRQAFGSNVALKANTWMSVSAFRTKVGAIDFLTMMRQTQPTPRLAVIQVQRSFGSSDIGLGQEAHPDGSGPLLDPLPNQESYQQ